LPATNTLNEPMPNVFCCFVCTLSVGCIYSYYAHYHDSQDVLYAVLMNSSCIP